MQLFLFFLFSRIALCNLLLYSVLISEVCIVDVKKIGERIKHARSLRNYTLEDIAKDIGVAKSTIQRYERGQIAHPKLPVLHSIANSLNVNPGWLVGKDINMNADMDTKYSKYISDSTMIFEITGRSLKNSPTVFQAICDSLSEMCEGVDNTTKYTDGIETVSNITEALKSPFNSYTDKAAALNAIIDVVLYDTKNDTLSIHFVLDKSKDVNYEQKLLEAFNLLNTAGKEKVIDYATDLSNMANYTIDTYSSDNSTVLNAAQARTDINVPEGADTSDDDIMDDKDF